MSSSGQRFRTSAAPPPSPPPPSGAPYRNRRAAPAPRSRCAGLPCARRAGDWYLSSRSSYEAAQEAGVLYLPSAERLRTLQRAKGGATGQDDALYSELAEVLEGREGDERDVVLLWDEINTIGVISFKVIKGRYQFYGLSDRPNPPQLFRDPKAKPLSRGAALEGLRATHALVFQVRPAPPCCAACTPALCAASSRLPRPSPASLSPRAGVHRRRHERRRGEGRAARRRRARRPQLRRRGAGHPLLGDGRQHQGEVRRHGRGWGVRWRLRQQAHAKDEHERPGSRHAQPVRQGAPASLDPRGARRLPTPATHCSCVLCPFGCACSQASVPNDLEDDRDAVIVLISDISHLIKKVVNHAFKSSVRSCHVLRGSARPLQHAARSQRYAHALHLSRVLLSLLPLR